MTVEKNAYRFECSFFNVSIQEGFDAFKACFEYLCIPAKVAMIYDDDSPCGRIEIRDKNEE